MTLGIVNRNLSMTRSGSCLQSYEEGFVHHGMFQAAEWTVEHVAPILKEQLQSNKG